MNDASDTVDMTQRPPVPRDRWDLAPWNRVTFQRVRQFMPTAVVRRGSGASSSLGEAPQPLAELQFACDGARTTLRDFLDASETDGFLVVHRGNVILEHYANGMTRETPHLAQSVSKSVVATVAGILAAENVLDCAAPVSAYLPELSAGAFRGATVQQLLDMTDGAVFDETYTATDSDVARFDAASGWKPRARPDWPATVWEFICSMRASDEAHGARFAYRSVVTDVLGFVLQRAGGCPLAELVSRKLWQPMGAEEDAYFTVDPAGFACACGGFNATLRDFARFAVLWAEGGRIDGRPVLSPGWIEATRRADHALFPAGYRDVLPQGAYHNQFWIEEPRRRVLLARGVFGQLVFIDPEARFAGVKLSSWPVFVDGARTRLAIAAMRALRDAIA